MGSAVTVGSGFIHPDQVPACIDSGPIYCRRRRVGLMHPLLARHEQGLFAECQAILHQTGGHRSADFNNLVLPKSELIVRAIGHRMAYDAAVDAKLDPTITNLYLASTVPLDASWLAEHAGSGGARQDAAVHQQ
ncbi:hypothetical protein DFH06DRAFT_1303818 [Mycena polygramma]|nr:hypothetical protein DFH06DRAFT_1303818 [Mycena polygramma]